MKQIVVASSAESNIVGKNTLNFLVMDQITINEGERIEVNYQDRFEAYETLQNVGERN